MMLKTKDLAITRKVPEADVFPYLRSKNVEIYLRSHPIDVVVGLGRPYLEATEQSHKYTDLINDGKAGTEEKKYILLHVRDEPEIVKTQLKECVYLENLEYLQESEWDEPKKRIFDSLVRVINKQSQIEEVEALRSLICMHSFRPRLDGVETPNYREQLKELQDILKNRMEELGLEDIGKQK